MYIYFKRFLDLFLSVLLLVAISPIFLILIIIVRIKMGSPVFFCQKRTGLNGKIFNIMKFRSMTNKKDEKGNLLPDNLRTTKLGRFLRASSLDELPEILNIIKGDMSVIGPRPLHSCYDPYYTEKERTRFNVRGGLIPPDSLDESPVISWEKQFEYESYYADNLSFKLDLKIFFNVFRILLMRKKSNYGSITRGALNEERKNMILNNKKL